MMPTFDFPWSGKVGMARFKPTVAALFVCRVGQRFGGGTGAKKYPECST